jgi:hypothetical protein
MTAEQPTQKSAVRPATCDDFSRMRFAGLIVVLAAVVVVAACLDSGATSTTIAHAGAAPPIVITTEDLEPDDSAPTLATLRPEPAVAVVPAPVPTPAEPPTPTTPTVVEHVSPSGVTESCTLLAPFPFEPPDVTADPESMRWYREDDREAIAKLCAMDLYATEATDTTSVVGVCPKLHWSTPALEMFDLSGPRPKDKLEYERVQCPRWRHRSTPKLAKLKVPVYAKEAESGVLYFHFSRLLGNAGFVYPATWRTVSRPELLRWSRRALEFIAEFTTTATPVGGWGVLRSRHRKATVTPDVVGGSLAKNPRGELTHYPFSYQADDRKVRIGVPAGFKKRPYYHLVASRRPLADQLALDVSDPVAYHAGVQLLAYAHDFTDLVIMDHLFNSRDRAGNIHAKSYLHFIDAGGHLRWKKAKTKTKAKPDSADTDAGAAASAPAVTVELERLLLKDNDDGLLWDVFGRLNATRLVPDLHHLDATTYARIQWLAGLMRDPATADAIRRYFVESVHVRDATYEVVAKRLGELADTLATAHGEGRLLLDLDLDAAIAAAPPLPAGTTEKKRSHRRRHRAKLESTETATPAPSPQP